MDHPLEALDRAFGARYDVWLRGGRYGAKRIDGSGEALSGETADELATAIRRDMTGETAAGPLADETDELVRLARFRAGHPHVIIGASHFGTWQARIPEPNGETVVVRHTLRELLDKLES